MGVIEVGSEKEFLDTIASSGNKLIVVDFWATWCGPCRMMGPHFDRCADEITDVIFLKVDVDELGELASEYDINCMPTFIFFKNGEKIEDMAGANKDKLKDMILKLK